MAERVLISTFGFDPEKVLRALRWIGYDRLARAGDIRSAGGIAFEMLHHFDQWILETCLEQELAGPFSGGIARRLALLQNPAPRKVALHPLAGR